METECWKSKLPGNEFDYLALMGALGDYRRPRDKVTALLRKGEIIRVKKGMYVLGPEYRQGAISREILGNQLYGPSYLSLEYALSFHQLIPERVETVTSVTLHKTKSFDTPLGRFTYRKVKKHYFSPGQIHQTQNNQRGFLIASPEKAIADKVYFTSGLHTLDHMQAYLFSDLRIEADEFAGLDSSFFADLSAIEGRRSLQLLAQLSQEMG